MPELIDLTPKFQTFYQLARNTDEETRWALWQEHYNFAAVPPVPEGKSMARNLLDGAWAQYAHLLTDLSAEVKRVQEQVTQTTTQLETLFQTTAPEFRLVTYVGGFEGNAFVAHDALCLPVEMPREWLEPVTVHELTHLFHHKLNGSSGGWERPLASLIVEEGLATRTVDILFPHLPIENRVGPQEWLNTCEANRTALLADALPLLEKKDNGTLMRFTMQPHPATGVDRAAYALGWWLVGELLAEGYTLSELARIPEAGLPELVRQCWF